MKPRTVSHIVSFLEALASERGASVNTIEAYRRDLADYEAHLKARGVDALKADTRFRSSATMTPNALGSSATAGAKSGAKKASPM